MREPSDGEKFSTVVGLVCLVVAILSDGPRSIGAAICFAAILWDAQAEKVRRDGD